VGDVIAVDGTTGVYLFTLVQPATELAKVIGIALTPTGDFLVAAQSFTSASHVTFTPLFLLLPQRSSFFVCLTFSCIQIFIYDKTTGKKKGSFLAGTPQNDFLPAELLWYISPIFWM